MSDTILLPTQPTKATKLVPSNLILFGLPKCGKTRAVVELPNSLLLDVENGGDYYECVKLSPDKDMTPVRRFNWLKEVAAAIRQNGRPYDFVVVDTISYLDEISEWVGTYNYMKSPQGKKFNRVGGIPGGEFLLPTDPEYRSVHDVPEGYGYRWSRNAMLDIMDNLKDLGKICTIFVCHVADKYIYSKENNKEVRVIDLSLTGKLRGIISRDVDAIGYVWNKDGELQISFKGNEEKAGGMRGANHIQGYEGKLDWDKIFKLKKSVNE